MLGWNELTVADTGQYRWLRYVGPDGSFYDVAEIEFVARARDVTVQAPARLRQLDDNQVITTYRNTSSRPVYDVRLDLSAYAVADRAARTVQRVCTARFPVVQPGRPCRLPGGSTCRCRRRPAPTTWSVAPATSSNRATGQPLEQAGGFSRSTLGPALSAAFDKEFVDLEAGDSEDAKLQITNHAARAVTVGWTYNRPPTANPGFALTPAQGTLTVPAGDTASATLTASAAADASGASPSPARVDLTAGAAGQPETRAGSVDLKVLWYPGAAPSLAATYNNKGITDDNNPTAGSFDGGEASYSAQGLAAAGLSPGATRHPRRADLHLARHRRPASPTTPRPTAR